MRHAASPRSAINSTKTLVGTITKGVVGGFSSQKTKATTSQWYALRTVVPLLRVCIVKVPLVCVVLELSLLFLKEGCLESGEVVLRVV